MSNIVDSATGRRLLRRRMSAVAVTTMVTVAIIAGAAPALADPVALQAGELVVNGGGESGITGWTGSLATATHGSSSGYPKSVIVGPSGATGATYAGGTFLLTGVGASSTASQTISLAPSAAAIDNGQVVADLSAYVGGFANQADNATVSYDFLNGVGTSVGTVSFGPVLAADRGDVSGFVPFAQAEPLAPGTRSVVVTINTVRSVAPANDGYVDNVSLVLDAPSPIAAPDAATTPENTPVTIAPLSNDTAGTGAALVPSSVRLLDGTTPVTSLTTADGTYQVDTTSGDVLFTPATGFSGTAPAVPYELLDSSGQPAQSTITVTVTFVAAPTLGLTKSASPSDAASFVTGTLITYSFVVHNTGNVTMTGIAVDEGSFTGTGPTPVATCPQPSLAPGDQEVCTAPYTLTAADAAAGGVDNTATVSGESGGVTTTSNSSSFKIPIAAAPALTLLKTAGPSTADAAGDVLTYTFHVTNTGNVSVGGVTIADTGFTGTGTLGAPSCSAGVLLPGQSIDCTSTYRLTQADIDGGLIENTATASASPTRGPVSVTSPPSTVTSTFVPQPALTFVKSSDRSTIATAGQTVRYTFTVTNSGNVTLSGISIADTVFTGAGPLGAISCPTTVVAPGDSVEFTADYLTVAGDLTGPTLENTATAQVQTPGGDALTSDPSTRLITVTPPVPPTGARPPLALTGTNSLPVLLTGMAAIAAGLVGLAIGWIRRRRHS